MRKYEKLYIAPNPCFDNGVHNKNYNNLQYNDL